MCHEAEDAEKNDQPEGSTNGDQSPIETAITPEGKREPVVVDYGEHYEQVMRVHW